MTLFEAMNRFRGGLGFRFAVAFALLAIAFVTGYILSWITRRILSRLATQTSAQWDDAIVARLGGPLTLFWASCVGYLGLAGEWLAPSDDQLVRKILRVALLAALFWAISRSIDVASHVIGRSAWASDRLSSRSFVSLGGKAVKVSIVVIAGLTMLSQMGYPVGSLVAGLGLGGLAFALAAQKTVENVFGAFSLAVDEPFRQGDFIKVDDVQGTVEAIGLRSTRIRTLDRTLVAIPNGKLAEMRTESFAARDRFRLACNLNLVYGTPAETVRRIVSQVEDALRTHPKVWPDAVVVRFKALAESSLDIEVMAWFQTLDWPEFQLVRQEMLLRFMEIVDNNKTSFAFPTRTVHVASGGSSESAAAKGSA